MFQKEEREYVLNLGSKESGEASEGARKNSTKAIDRARTEFMFDQRMSIRIMSAGRERGDESARRE